MIGNCISLIRFSTISLLRLSRLMRLSQPTLKRLCNLIFAIQFNLFFIATYSINAIADDYESRTAAFWCTLIPEYLGNIRRCNPGYWFDKHVGAHGEDEKIRYRQSMECYYEQVMEKQDCGADTSACLGVFVQTPYVAIWGEGLDEVESTPDERLCASGATLLSLAGGAKMVCTKTGLNPGFGRNISGNYQFFSRCKPVNAQLLSQNGEVVNSYRWYENAPVAQNGLNNVSLSRGLSAYRGSVNTSLQPSVQLPCAANSALPSLASGSPLLTLPLSKLSQFGRVPSIPAPTVDLMGGAISKIPGAVNVDIVCEAGRGLIRDASNTGIPSNSVGEIICSNPQAPFLLEAGRILKPGCKIYINGTKNNGFSNLANGAGNIKTKYLQQLNEVDLEIIILNGPLDPRFSELTFYRCDGIPIPSQTVMTTILRKVPRD